MTVEQMRQSFESGDYDRAFALALPLAEAGDCNAQELAGNGYQMGWGIAVDEVKAAYWYRKAMDQGSGLAANNLAGIVARGYGDARPDPDQAQLLLIHARNLGFVHVPKTLLC